MSQVQRSTPPASAFGKNVFEMHDAVFPERKLAPATDVTWDATQDQSQRTTSTEQARKLVALAGGSVLEAEDAALDAAALDWGLRKRKVSRFR